MPMRLFSLRRDSNELILVKGTNAFADEQKTTEDDEKPFVEVLHRESLESSKKRIWAVVTDVEKKEKRNSI